MGYEKEASIRIKIPPQLKSGSPSQHAEHPTTSRKPANKRRLIVDSDDDGGPDPSNASPVSVSPLSVRRIPPFKRSKTSESMNNTSACETDSNADAVDFPPESGHPISGADRAATGGAKRPRPREPPLKDEESIDVDVVYASAGPTTITTPPPITASESADISKERANTPPPPKKRKLPTIKKNKVPTGPTGTMAPVPPSTSGPSKAPAAGVGVGVGKAVGGVDEGAKLPANVASTRKPAATVGSADFDLRKPSVYAELFKTTGANTPRSGLNRREKDEERRKELNKLREEAKSKRALYAKHTFDLQGQWDKISRFEERLRQEKSSVLFPNILAAKLKDEWERERRRQVERDKEMERGGVSRGGKVRINTEREEGEVLRR